MKKILVLYTFVGHGHKKIAENIAAALRGSFEADLLDLMQLDGGKLGSSGSKLYFGLLKYFPRLWQWMYANKTFLKLLRPFRRPVAGFKSKKLQKILEEKKYDAVLSAHTNTSAVMSYLKKKGLYKGKFIVTFSDFDFNIFLAYDNVDLYLANVEAQKKEMLQFGIPAERILVCGITVQPPKSFNKAEIKQKFSIQEPDKVLLVLGGGFGFGFDQNLAENLKKINARIFIVCGTNEKLRSQLAEEFSGKPKIKVFGYVDFMPELYAIADMVVSKPGGLTVSECLQLNLPILVYECLPGPEIFNYQYLLDNHLIMAKDSDLKAQIEHELETHEFAATLKKHPLIKEIAQDGSKIRNKLTEWL